MYFFISGSAQDCDASTADTLEIPDASTADTLEIPQSYAELLMLCLYIFFLYVNDCDGRTIHLMSKLLINSLVPGRCGSDFESVISEHMLCIKLRSTCALRWILQSTFNAKSALVQVMVWCLLATSHYLSQCWSRFLSPYGVTGPQWVNYRFL